MKKKAAGPQRILIENISLFIGTDVHSVNVNLALINLYKGFLHTALSHADRFDLCTEKFNSGFIFIINKIIMVGFLLFATSLIRSFTFYLPLPSFAQTDVIIIPQACSEVKKLLQITIQHKIDRPKHPVRS